MPQKWNYIRHVGKENLNVKYIIKSKLGVAIDCFFLKIFHNLTVSNSEQLLLLLWNYGIKISCCKTVDNIKSDALFSREMKKCQISSIKGGRMRYIASMVLWVVPNSREGYKLRQILPNFREKLTF